jgi:hypothetical protein
MFAANSVTRFSELSIKSDKASMLKQLMRLAYCVCQQGCIVGRSEVFEDLVLQIFIVPPSFLFRIYIIAKRNVISCVLNAGFKS